VLESPQRYEEANPGYPGAECSRHWAGSCKGPGVRVASYVPAKNSSGTNEKRRDGSERWGGIGEA
jgi:hypothetical protein